MDLAKYLQSQMLQPGLQTQTHIEAQVQEKKKNSKLLNQGQPVKHFYLTTNVSLQLLFEQNAQIRQPNLTHLHNKRKVFLFTNEHTSTFIL